MKCHSRKSDVQHSGDRRDSDKGGYIIHNDPADLIAPVREGRPGSKTLRSIQIGVARIMGISLRNPEKGKYDEKVHNPRDLV